jgi:ubiquinone/menaquinone biosynthesis C-methylase UbiE
MSGDAAALAAVREGLPAGRAMPDVLEVGCGDGAFAARLLAECPGIALLAVDRSYAQVQLALERGVTATMMDVEQLLAPDDAYDVVVAMSVLHEVTDLDRGLAELRRVLRPGGRLVAVTEGDASTPTSFSSANGEEALRRHFTDVRRDDLAGTTFFIAGR